MGCSLAIAPPARRWEPQCLRAWQGLQMLAQVALRVVLLLTLLVGAGTIYDEALGDGPLPVLHPVPLAGEAPDPLAVAPTHAQALQNVQRLVNQLSPEIGAWLIARRERHQVIEGGTAESDSLYRQGTESQLLAAYRPWNGALYLAPAFFTLSKREQAAVLVHEYRHYRQNPAKRLSRTLAQCLGLGRLRYQSLLEDEAFAYEAEARHALGLP